ncbi:MAG: tRNA (adenosine(37)-N6)-threonylcarbamoyltransferase complex ATPase subunit type 1 TsaE [Candidatus Paceibacterota bacterium]
MIVYSNSPQETQKLAIKMAKETKFGIIALEGELGAGKTTFVQAFVKALGIKARIKSPTFTLIKKYNISLSKKSEILNSKLETNSKPKTQNPQFIIHIDCYRVRDHRDLIPLGIKEIFADQRNIVLIEWAERIKKILPKKLTRVHIDHIDQNKRKITIF